MISFEIVSGHLWEEKNMKTLLALLMTCAVLLQPALAQEKTKPQPPETLTLNDLANRPDRWPTEVVLAEDFDFTSGNSAKKGQVVRVLEFNGRDVVVDAGNDLVFQIEVASCNLLEAANAAWKALTPAQRAVDAKTLVADASLWPNKATCFVGFTLGDGSILEAGMEFDLMSVQNDGVHLFLSEPRTKLQVNLTETDVIARARERALIEPEKRPSRIAEALRGNMVDASGKPFKSEAIDSADVYALYFSASWCGPCRKFTPGFIEYIKEIGAANPKLAVVLMSKDETDADMQAYMQGDDMPWPAVPMATLNETPALVGYAGGGIPHLVVLDRHGRVLSSSYRGSQYLGPNHPLAALKKLVAAGTTK